MKTNTYKKEIVNKGREMRTIKPNPTFERKALTRKIPKLATDAILENPDLISQGNKENRLVFHQKQTDHQTLAVVVSANNPLERVKPITAHKDSDSNHIVVEIRTPEE